MAAEDGHHGRAGQGEAVPTGACAAGLPQRAEVATLASVAQADCWGALRALTPARLALGRAGASLPTQEVLRFGWDHAQARDAVQRPLDVDSLQRDIAALGLPTIKVASRAPDRVTYLMRPDLGRRLDPQCEEALDRVAPPRCDLALVVGDGLSSLAVQRNAPPMLSEIVRRAPADWHLSQVVIATQARVALGDEIGERLHAVLVAILIGERPGLSSPDSLGIYLTWQPCIGRTDAERNCISNIRPEGLSYAQAARKLIWLCSEARRRKATGVRLKDGSHLLDIGAPGLPTPILSKEPKA